MRRVLFALLTVAVTLFAEVDWAMDYSDALEESESSGKPILVMIGQEDCNYCSYMKNRVFTTPKVARFVDEHFVPVELDLHSDPIPLKLKPHGTPTFYIVGKGGKKVSRPIVGAAPAGAFIERLEKELKRFRSR